MTDYTIEVLDSKYNTNRTETVTVRANSSKAAFDTVMADRFWAGYAYITHINGTVFNPTVIYI